MLRLSIRGYQHRGLLKGGGDPQDQTCVNSPFTVETVSKKVRYTSTANIELPIASARRTPHVIATVVAEVVLANTLANTVYAVPMTRSISEVRSPVAKRN